MDRARGAFCAARSRRCVGRGIACVLPHLAEGLQSDLSQWTGNLHRRVRWALSDLFVVRMLSVQRSRSTLPGQHKGPDRDREGQEGDRCGPPHWMRPELRRKALRLERRSRETLIAFWVLAPFRVTCLHMRELRRQVRAAFTLINGGLDGQKCRRCKTSAAGVSGPDAQAGRRRLAHVQCLAFPPGGGSTARRRGGSEIDPAAGRYYATSDR